MVFIKYTKVEALERLKSFCKELGRKPKLKEIENKKDFPSIMVFRNYFGSMFNAFNLTGYSIEKDKCYSKEYLKSEILRVASILGKVPTEQEFNKLSSVSIQPIKDRYGWSKFLIKCGLVPNRRNYTKEELLKMLKDFYIEHKRIPSEEDFNKMGEIRFTTFVDHFGSWNNALQEAKLELKQNLYKAKDEHICYNIPELYIDNWMYENKVSHEKEVYYPFHKIYNKNSRKRCDWKIGEQFIELFGLVRRQDYLEKIEKKRRLCEDLNLDLVSLYPKDIRNLDFKLGVFKDIV